MVHPTPTVTLWPLAFDLTHTERALVVHAALAGTEGAPSAEGADDSLLSATVPPHAHTSARALTKAAAESERAITCAQRTSSSTLKLGTEEETGGRAWPREMGSVAATGQLVGAGRSACAGRGK